MKDEQLAVSATENELANPVLNLEEIQQIKRRSVSGVVSFLIRTVLIQGIGFVAAALLGAYFSPEDYAVYGFVLQIIGLLTFISDVGFAAALIQKREEPTLTEYRTVFTVQQALSWFVVIVAFLIGSTGFVQREVGDVGLWLLLSLALSFPLASFKTIPSIMLERRLNFSKLALPQIFEQLIFQGVLITLALRGMGALSYAYAILARSAVGVLIMWYLQPWKVGLMFDKTVFKTLFSFGAKFQVNDLLARIKDQLFTLIVGTFLSPKEFGYVQWAKNWSLYPYNLTVQNVMAVTFPTFSRLQQHPDLLRKAIEKSLFFITVVIFPLLLGMCLFIWPVTQVVSRYEKWEPAVFSFILFTLTVIAAAISSPITNTLNALGKINESLKLMVMWTVLTWVVTPICMKFFGYQGVAIASLLITVTTFLPVRILKKYVAFNLIEQIWRQAAATVVMVIVGLLGMGLWTRSIAWLLLGLLIVGSSYMMALVLIAYPKLKHEISSLRQR